MENSIKPAGASVIVGNNIRRFRKERGLTMEQLAKRVSRSKSAISKYENGMTIELETLVQIAQVLDVSVHLLLKGVITSNEERELSQNSIANYFDQDKLYLYYYDGIVKRMKVSLIEKQVSADNFGGIPIKLYFNYIKPDKFWLCEYTYSGVWTEIMGAASLLTRNIENSADVSLFIFTVPLRNAMILSGLSLGLSDSPHAPVCVKVILSKKPIEDYERLKLICKMSKNDISNLKQFNKLHVQYEFIDELFLSTND